MAASSHAFAIPKSWRRYSRQRKSTFSFFFLAIFKHHFAYRIFDYRSQDTNTLSSEANQYLAERDATDCFAVSLTLALARAQKSASSLFAFKDAPNNQPTFLLREFMSRVHYLCHKVFSYVECNTGEFFAPAPLPADNIALPSSPDSLTTLDPLSLLSDNESDDEDVQTISQTECKLYDAPAIMDLLRVRVSDTTNRVLRFQVKATLEKTELELQSIKSDMRLLLATFANYAKAVALPTKYPGSIYLSVSVVEFYYLLWCCCVPLVLATDRLLPKRTYLDFCEPFYRILDAMHDNFVLFEFLGQ